MHGRRYLPAAGAVALAILLASCSGSGFAYVKSSDSRAFFKVPLGWKQYSKEQLLVASGQSLSPATDSVFPWLIGYDADPRPSVNHILALGDAPRYPVVMAQVRQLSPQDQDALSLSNIRNAVYPVDRLADNDAAELISAKNLVLPGGFHGQQLVYQVTLGGISNVALGNIVIEVNQIGLVDPATQKLYLFTVRCESHCYRDNQKLISQIVESWTVKER